MSDDRVRDEMAANARRFAETDLRYDTWTENWMQLLENANRRHGADGQKRTPAAYDAGNPRSRYWQGLVRCYSGDRELLRRFEPMEKIYARDLLRMLEEEQAALGAPDRRPPGANASREAPKHRVGAAASTAAARAEAIENGRAAAHPAGPPRAAQPRKGGALQQDPQGPVGPASQLDRLSRLQEEVEKLRETTKGLRQQIALANVKARYEVLLTKADAPYRRGKLLGELREGRISQAEFDAELLRVEEDARVLQRLGELS
jgi:hypothetical protein